MGSLRQHEDDLRIAERAAEWLTALDGADEAVQGQFMAWLEESPRHVREFLLMQTLDFEATGVDPQKRIDVDALLATVTPNVVSLGRSASSDAAIQSFTQPARARRWVAIGAGLSLALLGLWQVLPMLSHARTYITATGEQRAIELGDGSIVHLNTGSKVRVRFDESQRDVRLLEGEALFKVALDTKRPFRVHVDGTTVRALGTQFDVYRRQDGPLVSVIEGRVEVSQDRTSSSSRVLGAGEALHVTPKNHVVRAAVNTNEVAAWRQRRLIFREDTLEDIAAEFNRYNRAPKLIVQGQEVAVRRFGGIFDADDPESFVSYLAQDPRLAFDRTAGTVVVRAR